MYHSAVATFYASSDLCGADGMCRERIQSTPAFHGHPRHDTIFVVLDDSKPSMEEMEIGGGSAFLLILLLLQALFLCTNQLVCI